MKILIQWARTAPNDWVEVDSSNWVNTPQRPVPSLRLDELDDKLSEGYVHALNVQGIVFCSFDHYAIEHYPDNVKVICWNDDMEDWADDRHALEWIIYDPAYDVRINSINTRQMYKIYCENPARITLTTECIYTGDWGSFIKPAHEITRHGIWVSDEINEQLIAARTTHSWREWIN